MALTTAPEKPLGAFLRDYPMGLFGRAIDMFSPLGFLFLSGVFTVVVFSIDIDVLDRIAVVKSQRGSRAETLQLQSVFFWIGIAILGISAPLLIRYILTDIRRIGVFEHGFVIHTHRKVRPILWNEVGAVWKIVVDVPGSPLPKLLRFEFALHGGEKINLESGDLATLDEFGELAQQEVASRALPKALQDLAAGKELSFGKVRLSNDCLITPACTWKWHEIDRLGFDEFFCLTVVRQGESLPTHASHNCFPNHPVFFTLARRLIDEDHRRRSPA